MHVGGSQRAHTSYLKMAEINYIVLAFFFIISSFTYFINIISNDY